MGMDANMYVRTYMHARADKNVDPYIRGVLNALTHRETAS
jgi:hypothetical protein